MTEQAGVKLWKEMIQGDKLALRKLHELYFYQMSLYASKSIDDPRVVEELVSDCFIKLWENRKKISIDFSFKSYIFNILRNRIVDFYRSKKNIVESMSDLPEFPELPDLTYFEDQRAYARLYKALESLPEQRKRILKLAVYDSLTYDQIASKLGISKNTVKSQIKNAYRTLREQLDITDFILLFI